MPASTRRAAIIQRLPAFCVSLKRKRRWALGRLVAEPRGSRFSGVRATAALELLRLAATIGRHGVAAESLEVLRQPKYFKAGSSNVQSPILEVAKSVLSKFVRTWHRHCETHLMKRGWRAEEVADFTTKGYDASPHWFAPHQVRDCGSGIDV